MNRSIKVKWDTEIVGTIDKAIVGYIYIVRCGHFDYYKIGHAASLNFRLFGLQTSNPFKLELVTASRVINYKTIEYQLHHKFAPNRVRGEWFKLSKNDVENIVEILQANEMWHNSYGYPVDKQ